MERKWTEEQRQVIDARNQDILVSAAAGSGKTAVLVQRIIGRVMDQEHPVDIDRMLVVTFTNAAAAEMRERIFESLELALEKDPGNRHLLRQVTLVHHAQISTIHSFCMYVIRNHFHEIGLDPDFRMAEEGEITLLISQSLDEMLEEEYEQRREEFLAFMDAYALGGKDRGVRDMILSLHRFAESYPWPRRWLEELREPYAVRTKEDLLKAGWMGFVFSLAHAQIDGARTETEMLLEICDRPDGPACYRKGLQQDMELYEELLAAADFISLQQSFAASKFSTIGNSRGFEGDVAQLEFVKATRDGLKKMITRLKEDFFLQSPQEILETQMRQLPCVEELLFLTKRFGEVFEKKKRRRNILDFGDLEHLALQILVDEETGECRPAAEEFIRYFEEIMVDEYQDSNYIQEAILAAISQNSRGGHNRFMVGDVKQSIYRFRLARPEIFMEKYRAYEAGGESQIKIDLRKNFRSRPQVLEFANDIFYPLMRRDLGNVDYNEQSALYPGAKDYPPAEDMFAPEILIGDAQEGWEEAGIEDRGAFESKLVADRICALKKTQLVTDAATKKLRPMEYRDVVILMRSPKSVGETFAEVLSENGIPAHLDSHTGYFSAVEVETVLQLLQVLDNPYQDIPLAGVLHSPMFSFSNDELALIRSEGRELSFHQAFFAYARSHPEHQKIQGFCRFLEEMRKKIPDTPIHALIEELLERTGFLEYVTALPEGALRRANLERLTDEAVKYENSSYQGLFHFVNYINRLQKYEVDLEGADMINENDDVVRIMSIHKSKGLEFPVVFVCGLGRQFNRQDSRQLMVLHGTYGMAFDAMDAVRHLKYATVHKKALVKALDMDTLGEELRILYVAVTRAREKIILTGACAKAAEMTALRHRETEPLPLWKRMSAKTPLEWIAMSLACRADKYLLRCVTPAELVVSEVAKQTESGRLRRELEALGKDEDEAVTADIFRELSYVYPYSGDSNYKNKYSVSEIKHRAIEQIYMQQDEAKPLFLEREKEPTIPVFISRRQTEEVWQGALRGTATHRYLECFDFARDHFEDTYAVQLKEMVASGRLTEEMAALLSEDKMTAFLRDAMAARMAAAARRGELFVEKPFVMSSTAAELFGEAKDACGEMILVQGIMDVFFREEDGIVLLDYKTDRVKDAAELRERYRSQLLLYAEAIRAAMDCPVKQICLYSFCLQKVIEI